MTWLLVARRLSIQRDVAQIIARLVYFSAEEPIWEQAIESQEE